MLLYVGNLEDSITDHINLNFIETLGNALSFLTSFLFGDCSGRLRGESCAIDVEGYGNNDTKMPPCSRGRMMSGQHQVISRDENPLSEGHGSLTPLWPRPNIVEFLRRPTAKKILGFHAGGVLCDEWQEWRLHVQLVKNMFFWHIHGFFRPPCMRDYFLLKTKLTFL